MIHGSSLNLSQFPQSPYAEELRAGRSPLRFAPELEAMYRRQHLEQAHVRTRAWSILSAVFAVVFTIQQLSTYGLWEPLSLLHIAYAPAALALACLPWSRFYQTHYLPAAQIALPVFAFVTAPLSARAVGEGNYEALAQLALQTVGIFQFTGLLYHRALITCIALVAGFAVGTVAWGLPPEASIKYVATLALATFLGAVAFRGTAITARRQFLEAHLLGELLETDPLTGLKNRRSFDDHLQRAWLQAQRDGRTVAVVMMDVDDFKRFNDHYGHQAGDEALRRVSGTIMEFGRRPLDLAARYGGEEFALILHDVSMDHARHLAEHLLRQVQALGIPHAAARTPGVVTLSIGVAVAAPEIGRTPQSLVQLADEALYAAKAAGRNRVVVRGPEAYREVDTGVFAQPGTVAGRRAAG